jgi:hypothetical protein
MDIQRGASSGNELPASGAMSLAVAASQLGHLIAVLDAEFGVPTLGIRSSRNSLDAPFITAAVTCSYGSAPGVAVHTELRSARPQLTLEELARERLANYQLAADPPLNSDVETWMRTILANVADLSATHTDHAVTIHGTLHPGVTLTDNLNTHVRVASIGATLIAVVSTDDTSAVELAWQ